VRRCGPPVSLIRQAAIRRMPSEIGQRKAFGSDARVFRKQSSGGRHGAKLEGILMIGLPFVDEVIQ
jgi:hypothetical protein